MGDVKQFRLINSCGGHVNLDAIEIVEGLLERLKAGESVAVALVDVKANGDVYTAWSQSDGHYHALNSGCARLAQRVAQD